MIFFSYFRKNKNIIPVVQVEQTPNEQWLRHSLDETHSDPSGSLVRHSDTRGAQYSLMPQFSSLTHWDLNSL